MTIAQPSAHWKRLVELPALPGWFLLFWRLISALSNIDFIHSRWTPIWKFLISPSGNIVLILAGLAWLVAIVLWPRKDNVLSDSKTAGFSSIDAERAERMKAIEGVYATFNPAIERIEQSVRELANPATLPLKQRTIQVANELFELLKKQGSQPPDPLSLPLSERDTEAKQRQAMKAYFDWQTSTYYQYMAFFRERVLKIDYELAAAGILTKLNPTELDPLARDNFQNQVIDIKTIAEKLLLIANQM